MQQRRICLSLLQMMGDNTGSCGLGLVTTLEFWAFLKDENNRAVVGWILSGLLLAVPAIWTAWKQVISKAGRLGAPSRTVMGTHGSIVAGGDIHAGGSIHIGPIIAPHAADDLSPLALEILSAAVADPDQRGIMVVNTTSSGFTVQIRGRAFEQPATEGRSGQECQGAVYDLQKHGMVRDVGNQCFQVTHAGRQLARSSSGR